MITEMIGSPISGRSTTTCSTMPNTIMTIRVSGKPIQNGSWYSIRKYQQIQAPISRNSPWAMLITFDAL